MPDSPFEIITPNKSKKGKSTGIIVAIIIIVFLVVSVLIGLYLVRQNQNPNEKAAEVCTTGYTSTHIRECKKNCSNENAPGAPWYWINATTGASCGTGTDGTPKYWCDLDECNLSSVQATSTPTPTPSPSPSPSPTPSPIAQSGTIQCNGSCTSSSQCASGNVCYISSGTTGSCRASACVTLASCICPTTAATATATATPTPTPIPTKTPTPVPGSTKTPTPLPTVTATQTPTGTAIALATATSTPTVTPTTIAQVQTTPLPIPETGTSWPTVLGGVFGVLVIIGAFVIAF